jgi:Protein of unknwon function (DUF3310)
MSKYKVGDVVEIVDKINGHGFAIGELVEIIKVYRDGGSYDAMNDGGDWWAVEESEISDVGFTIPTQDEPDMVNSPAHYGTGSIECIEYIEDFLTTEEYIGYLRGNIAKYLHRFRYKNGIEDLRKAEWYLNRLSQAMGDE